MTHIEALNRWLAEALGYIDGSATPRFKWVWSPDSKYYLRPAGHADFQEWTWADRLGKVWLLAHWRLPFIFDQDSGSQKLLTKEDWWTLHHGEFPYPENGAFYAYPETALPPGHLPTIELTMNYIRVIDRQMSMTHRSHMLAVKQETEDRERQNANRWTEYTQDFAPALNNWNSGSRSGHVSWGGVRDVELAPARA